MSQTIILVSSSNSPARYLQIARRKISPILDKLLGTEAPKELTISGEQLLINGTPIGDWRLMSNFELDGAFLIFDYGSSHKVQRAVSFGIRGWDKEYYKVLTVHEYTKGKPGIRTVFERDIV